MRIFLIISSIIFAISLIGLLLYAAVAIPSFGMWFYYWQYDVNGTYARVSMEPEHLHEVTRHMIRYMQGFGDRETGLQIMTIVGGQPRYFFSDIEIRHMVDVYDLFAIGFIVRNIFIVCIAAASAAFALWGREHLRILARAAQIASVSLFAVLALLVIVTAINWHHAFVVFHEIFFNNDYWILNPAVDLLINIVPYEFFITLSIVLGSIFAAGLVIIFAAATILLRRGKPFLRSLP